VNARGPAGPALQARVLRLALQRLVMSNAYPVARARKAAVAVTHLVLEAIVYILITTQLTVEALKKSSTGNRVWMNSSS